MIVIRRITPSDMVHVMDIDLKCFDATWDRETWALAAENAGVEVLTIRNGPAVGVSVFAFDRDTRSVCILKIAVKPAYRGRGFGKALLDSIKLFARTMGSNHLFGGVPESLCQPGEPRDVSKWLTRQGFRATEVLHDAAVGPEDGPEDGIKFEMTLGDDDECHE